MYEYVYENIYTNIYMNESVWALIWRLLLLHCLFPPHLCHSLYLSHTRLLSSSQSGLFSPQGIGTHTFLCLYLSYLFLIDLLFGTFCLSACPSLPQRRDTLTKQNSLSLACTHIYVLLWKILFVL